MDSRRVLVTGGSKGIGRAIALEASRRGFHVTIHYGRDQAGAETTKEHILKANGSCDILGFDVRERENVKRFLEDSIKKQGPFYGVVQNAGICRDAAFPALSDEDWDDVIDVNLNGFYNVVKPCVMPMVRSKKGGRIIVISSVSGVMGNRGQTNYSASKAAVIGAVKSLAVELAKRSITVNSIAPGLIETDILDEQVVEHAKPLIPMQRVGTPNEVASLAGFLLSDDASYITRQVIGVNGGMI